MKTMHALLFSVALATSLAQAAGPTGTAADYGAPADASAAVTRRIVLTPETRSVQVNNGETVEFVSGGRSFRWQVDTFISDTNFQLAKIAPPGLAPAAITVYVGANPTYRGY
ncbi:MAG: CzcE family metal-binding protein [Sphingomonadaceae bacterium]